MHVFSQPKAAEVACVVYNTYHVQPPGWLHPPQAAPATGMYYKLACVTEVRAGLYVSRVAKLLLFFIPPPPPLELCCFFFIYIYKKFSGVKGGIKKNTGHISIIKAPNLARVRCRRARERSSKRTVPPPGGSTSTSLLGVVVLAPHYCLYPLFKGKKGGIGLLRSKNVSFANKN
jgi:hypothetical protein